MLILLAAISCGQLGYAQQVASPQTHLRNKSRNRWRTRYSRWSKHAVNDVRDRHHRIQRNHGVVMTYLSKASLLHWFTPLTCCPSGISHQRYCLCVFWAEKSFWCSDADDNLNPELVRLVSETKDLRTKSAHHLLCLVCAGNAFAGNQLMLRATFSINSRCTPDAGTHERCKRVHANVLLYKLSPSLQKRRSILRESVYKWPTTSKTQFKIIRIEKESKTHKSGVPIEKWRFLTLMEAVLEPAFNAPKPFFCPLVIKRNT